jgi:gamma-butyrobetaine dioxygenase
LTGINLEDDICEFEVAGNKILLSWLFHNRLRKTAADPVLSVSQLWRCELSASDIPRTQAYGLSIVDSLADNADAGTEVARKVGFIRETNLALSLK